MIVCNTLLVLNFDVTLKFLLISKITRPSWSLSVLQDLPPSYQNSKMPGRSGRNRARDPHYYWNNTASTNPEAQELATRLGIEFPSNQNDGFKSGLK